MPIQVLDAQGNVVHTLDAQQNPQARQQAEMMAAAVGGSVNELPYNGGGGEMGGMMPPGGPQMGGMMPPGMGGPPPGGGQLNGGSPTIPGGPGENTGAAVPPELMAQQGGGPPQRPNHLEVIRMMQQEELQNLTGGDQRMGSPLDQQMAAMPPIAPPMLAPPQIPGMQGPQGMPGMPPGMPPGMGPQGPPTMG